METNAVPGYSWIVQASFDMNTIGAYKEGRQTMVKRSLKYALGMAAGAMLLAFASSGASAMTVSALPGVTSAPQASSALFDQGTDSAKIEKIYWCNRWGCHPGGRWWGWRPYYRPYYGRGWCYYHPYRCRRW